MRSQYRKKYNDFLIYPNSITLLENLLSSPFKLQYLLYLQILLYNVVYNMNKSSWVSEFRRAFFVLYHRTPGRLNSAWQANDLNPYLTFLAIGMAVRQNHIRNNYYHLIIIWKHPWLYVNITVIVVITTMHIVWIYNF